MKRGLYVKPAHYIKSKHHEIIVIISVYNNERTTHNICLGLDI